MTLPQANRITIDWRAQFYAFCTEHSGDPVTFEGRLLFRDGWTHSATSHSGPEFPPPDEFDELRRLQRAYRTLYLQRVRPALAEASNQLTELEALQRQSSVPLQRVVRVRDEATRRWQNSSEEIDFDTLRARVALLQTELEKCETELKNLT